MLLELGEIHKQVFEVLLLDAYPSVADVDLDFDELVLVHQLLPRSYELNVLVFFFAWLSVAY